ncbi:hypothetical protein PAPYR_9712 [Paratrimastix pyriformis]|uniref:Uncharacterized protein n=1 Tax=Paratrimastix pyriformis TaxID=342808 RepID=A0ABQ8UDE7_9EUKA|nr:hypothetical protein PAPYR_9712 [Paratrimastix pyriformis]
MKKPERMGLRLYANLNLYPPLSDFFDDDSLPLSMEKPSKTIEEFNQNHKNELAALRSHVRDVLHGNVDPLASDPDSASRYEKDGIRAFRLLESLVGETCDILAFFHGHGCLSQNGGLLLCAFGGEPVRWSPATKESAEALLNPASTPKEILSLLEPHQREWLDLGKYLKLYLLSQVEKRNHANITILISACHSGLLRKLFDDPRIQELSLGIYFACGPKEEAEGGGQLIQLLLGSCPTCEREHRHKPSAFALATQTYLDRGVCGQVFPNSKIIPARGGPTDLPPVLGSPLVSYSKQLDKFQAKYRATLREFPLGDASCIFCRYQNESSAKGPSKAVRFSPNTSAVRNLLGPAAPAPAEVATAAAAAAAAATAVARKNQLLHRISNGLSSTSVLTVYLADWEARPRAPSVVDQVVALFKGKKDVWEITSSCPQADATPPPGTSPAPPVPDQSVPTWDECMGSLRELLQQMSRLTERHPTNPPCLTVIADPDRGKQIFRLLEVLIPQGLQQLDKIALAIFAVEDATSPATFLRFLDGQSPQGQFRQYVTPAYAALHTGSIFERLAVSPSWGLDELRPQSPRATQETENEILYHRISYYCSISPHLREVSRRSTSIPNHVDLVLLNTHRFHLGWGEHGVSASAAPDQNFPAEWLRRFQGANSSNILDILDDAVSNWTVTTVTPAVAQSPEGVTPPGGPEVALPLAAAHPPPAPDPPMSPEMRASATASTPTMQQLSPPPSAPKPDIATTRAGQSVPPTAGPAAAMLITSAENQGPLAVGSQKPHLDLVDLIEVPGQSERSFQSCVAMALHSIPSPPSELLVHALEMMLRQELPYVLEAYNAKQYAKNLEHHAVCELNVYWLALANVLQRPVLVYFEDDSDHPPASIATGTAPPSVSPTSPPSSGPLLFEEIPHAFTVVPLRTSSREKPLALSCHRDQQGFFFRLLTQQHPESQYRFPLPQPPENIAVHIHRHISQGDKGEFEIQCTPEPPPTISVTELQADLYVSTITRYSPNLAHPREVIPAPYTCPGQLAAPPSNFISCAAVALSPSSSSPSSAPQPLVRLLQRQVAEELDAHKDAYGLSVLTLKEQRESVSRVLTGHPDVEARHFLALATVLQIPIDLYPPNSERPERPTIRIRGLGNRGLLATPCCCRFGPTRPIPCPRPTSPQELQRELQRRIAFAWNAEGDGFQVLRDSSNEPPPNFVPTDPETAPPPPPPPPPPAQHPPPSDDEIRKRAPSSSICGGLTGLPCGGADPTCAFEKPTGVENPNESPGRMQPCDSTEKIGK